MNWEKWVLLLSLLLFSVCAYPTMYKCKDASGHWIFTDKAGACNKAKAKTGDNGLEAPPALPSLPEAEKPSNSGGSGFTTRKRHENLPTGSTASDNPVTQGQPIAEVQSTQAPEVGSSKTTGKEKLAYLLLAVGVIISLYYGVILLVEAFQASVWWGLGYIFVPMVAFLFVAVHWESAKSPFLRSFLALPFLFGAWALMPMPLEGSEYGTPVEYASPSTEDGQNQEEEDSTEEPSPVRGVGQNMGFKCEGKTRCSEMTSCEEAKFYLKNCPSVEMDGDNDGIPCERQLCK